MRRLDCRQTRTRKEIGALDRARAPVLPVPPRTRLVHVGAQKTGTTAIQASLVAARDLLPEQDVRLIGRSSHPDRSTLAVLGRRPPTGEAPPPIRLWEQLVRQVRSATEERIVISDENFSFADPPTIARIARDLDPARLRIVVTLRHLGRILPSHWQQNVQIGITESYDQWLRDVLQDPAHRFWVTQRHDALVMRWVNEIGVDRVMVVVVDEHDRGMLYRTFEALLGLRAGTLPEIASGENRSLTLPEAEAVRAFNVAAHQAGFAREAQARYMRFGGAARLKRREPGPGEARIETPRWAIARARDLEQEMVAAIEATGVQVIGDVDTLTADLEDARDPVAGGTASELAASELTAIPPDVVGTLALGVMQASSPSPGARPSRWQEPPGVGRLSTRALALLLAKRVVGVPIRQVRRRAMRRG